MLMTDPRFYDLLPIIYRQLDASQGEPLRALLEVIEREWHIMKSDVEGLYDDWFIETCKNWVVPYIGELVGVRSLNDEQHIIFSQRVLVANAIAYNRRKGTPATLEHAAQNMTGWPTLVVEFFERISATQSLLDLRPGRGGTANLRHGKSMALLGTPFDAVAHTVDVHNIAANPPTAVTRRGLVQGKYNIPNVGLFFWRLQSYPVVGGRARDIQPGCYTFNPFGLAMPLFNQPHNAVEITQLVAEMDVPAPLRRSPLSQELQAIGQGKEPTTHYFGDEPVLQVFVKYEARFKITEQSLEKLRSEGVPAAVLEHLQGLKNQEVKGEKQFLEILTAAIGEEQTVQYKALILKYAKGFWPLSADHIQIGDLCDWPSPLLPTPGSPAMQDVISSSHCLDQEKVTLDPVTGRLAFPAGMQPVDVRVNYSYGFSADIGGGPYDRRHTYGVPEPHTWLAWVGTDWNSNTANGNHYPTLQKALAAWSKASRPGIIRIADSYTYDLREPAGEQRIVLPRSCSLSIEAANGQCPCILGALLVSADAPGTGLTLNGLWLDGQVSVHGPVHLDIRHCTLKPPQASKTGVYSLKAEAGIPNRGLHVTITHSIIGPIRLPADITGLEVSDSILDGVSGYALQALEDPKSGPTTALERTTVFGPVAVTVLAQASDVIFTDPIIVQQRQSGFMRFSYYVSRGSQTPQQHYRCQPDLALERAHDNGERAEKEAILSQLSPAFTSVVYGAPGYAQLCLSSPKEILQGASDGSEMGAFSHLQQPQRVAHVGTILDDYLPYGLQAGVFYMT
jgi:hypothetical protein